MIAGIGYHLYLAGQTADLDVDAYSRLGSLARPSA